jgi:MFS family permease
MSKTSRSPRLSLIFLVLSALYFFSTFYRFSSAVISPNLIEDLGLNAETLGLLGGAFFYSFALLQVPMGPMLDRIGPRSVLTAFALVGALGSFIFAFGDSFWIVFLGRVLLGVGMSSVLMGSMKVFVLHFSPGRFATLVGVLLSTGTVGAVFAASPLAYLTSFMGWRRVFLLCGAVTAILAFLVYWILGLKEKDEAGMSSPSPPKVEVLPSIRLILKSLAFWQIGTFAFFRYGTLMGLQGLWLGPYLIHIKGYSPVQAGNVLIVLAMGTIVGSPVAGQLSDRVFRSSKGLALAGLSLYALSLIPLTGAVEIRDPTWYGLLFFFIGFFNSFGLLVFPHAKGLFPDSISGTVTTSVNFFTMTGGAIFMPLLGKVIARFPSTGHSYPAEAYHLAFLICFLGMTASIVFYAFSKSKTR